MNNFNGVNMNNYFMFQHFLNSQRNNNMFQQNLNNVNFNQNMFQQCMNQMNMNPNFNQPNFNFNPNMHIANLNNAFIQYMFQMFFKWMMSQCMNCNMNSNFNFNINNNNKNNMNNRFNNFFNNNSINNNNNINSRNNIYRKNLFRNNTISYLNYKFNEPKQILPRIKTLIKVTDFEKGNIGYLLNIIFVAGNGLRVNIPIPPNKTLEYLFRVYAKRIGLSENVLGTSVLFLYDGSLMNVKDKRSIGQVFRGNVYVITVVETSNVLGA